MFASGMASITTSLLAVLKPGDHIVASPVLYGESFYFLQINSQPTHLFIPINQAEVPALVQEAQAVQAGSSAFAGASKGSLVTNGMTPDGFKVDANGAWVK